MTATVCPLCGVPRPTNAKRCVCNYTFEYDKLPPTARRSRPVAGLTQVVAVVAVAAAVATWALFAENVARADRARPELGLLLIASGIFGACGGILDWEFFMTNRRARRFVILLGRTGARFFYAILGGGLAGVGFGMVIA